MRVPLWFEIFQAIFFREAFLERHGIQFEDDDDENIHDPRRVNDYAKFLAEVFPPSDTPSIPLKETIKVEKVLPETAVSDIQQKIEQIKKNLTKSQIKNMQALLKTDQFQKNLIHLMGIQREADAIDLTLKGFSVFKDSPQLKLSNETLFNFSIPFFVDQIQEEISFEQFASVLELKELLLIFFYIQKENLNAQ